MAWEKLGSTTVGGASTPVNNSWKEIGRTTLSSAGDDITVSSLTAKDNLMILCSTISTGNIDGALRFNTDTGTNYSIRRSENGGSDVTSNTTNQTKLLLNRGHVAYPNTTFSVSDMNNISAQEKLVIGHSIAGVNGTGTAPDRTEMVGKWANTSAQVTSVTCNNSDSGSWDTGSEVVVLGCDNDEADSGTNFWQELASTVLTATHSGALTIPQFTTKKYLMIRYYINASTDCTWKVGTGGSIDSGANQYYSRYSNNGGGDSTLSYTSFLQHNPIVQGEVFIINKSDKEKLMIQHEVGQNQGSGAGGSGAGNVPNRREDVGKWANTSGQIDTLQYNKSGVSFYAGTTIKVYGAD